MSGNVYRYLDTLITAGSFSKAARVLQISQPSISQFVHRLETEVGTELVDRTAKPLRLTYAGECFMRTEREIEQLRSMRSRLIADIDEGVRGHVTIGSSHYRSTFFLAEVLPIFRREYPGVTVSLAEGTTKELEDFAFDGVTDLSLVIAPLYRDELEYAELFRERYLLAMSPEARVAKTVPQPASGGYASMPFNRLNGEPFITIKQVQKFRNLYEDLCRATRTTPRVMLESESPVAALHLASAGLGATFVTQTLAKRCRPAQPVRYFTIEPARPDRMVVAAYRKNGYLTKAARSLIEVMRRVAETEFADG